MSSTRHFGLPLLAAAQAQKHITVNEALARMDAIASGLVESATTPAPPAAPGDGDAYIVPPGGEASWGSDAGALGLHLNGLWHFLAPRAGQRVWVRDAAAALEHDGASWRPVGATPAMAGHAALRSFTIDHELAAGGNTGAIIPDKAVVIGVTGRVLEPIAGDGVSGWSLGVPDAVTRYGTGYGCAAGSFAQGLTSAPMPYFADTPLRVEGEGGTIASGVVRLCVHCHILTPPAMV